MTPLKHTNANYLKITPNKLFIFGLFLSIMLLITTTFFLSYTDMPSQLSNIKPILEIIGLEKDKIDDVMKKSKTEDYKGKFAAQIAVELGYTTSEEVQKGLGEQAKLIADAAVEDMKDLRSGSKSLDFPLYMKPHWGNAPETGKANSKIENPTIVDSATASANVGKLIVLLTNTNPSFGTDQIQMGVLSAKYLTHSMLNHDANLLNSKSSKWIKDAESALLTVAILNKIPESLVKSYVENRFSEIRFGVEFVKNLSQGADKSASAAR